MGGGGVTFTWIYSLLEPEREVPGTRSLHQIQNQKEAVNGP